MKAQMRHFLSSRAKRQDVLLLNLLTAEKDIIYVYLVPRISYWSA